MIWLCGDKQHCTAVASRTTHGRHGRHSNHTGRGFIADITGLILRWIQGNHMVISQLKISINYKVAIWLKKGPES